LRDERFEDKFSRKEERKMMVLKRFLTEEDGLSTVEIILILVVLVGLVLIFKEEMIKIVESIFKTITKQVNKV
jgi:Flp pilus assembly pilin Flp